MRIRFEDPNLYWRNVMMTKANVRIEQLPGSLKMKVDLTNEPASLVPNEEYYRFQVIAEPFLKYRYY